MNPLVWYDRLEGAQRLYINICLGIGLTFIFVSLIVANHSFDTYTSAMADGEVNIPLSTESKLEGVWKLENGGIFLGPKTITFNSSGRVEFSGNFDRVYQDYFIDGDQLVLNENGNLVAMEYSLDGDRLLLIDSEGTHLLYSKFIEGKGN